MLHMPFASPSMAAYISKVINNLYTYYARTFMANHFHDPLFILLIQGIF